MRGLSRSQSPELDEAVRLLTTLDKDQKDGKREQGRDFKQ
jgi:hypothetical protein